LGQQRPVDVGFRANTGRAEGLVGTGDNSQEEKLVGMSETKFLSSLVKESDQYLQFVRG
jgi:hypothetical protein